MRSRISLIPATSFVLALMLTVTSLCDNAGGQEAKTEPAKTEPAKTEPAKTEPAKTEPAKTEPAKTEPAKTEPAKTEPAKTEPAKTEPAKTEPAKTEPAKTEPAKTEPAKTEPAKTEPAKTEPAKTEPAKTEPAKTEPAKTEPAKTEPAKTEPAKTEPAKKERQKISSIGYSNTPQLRGQPWKVHDVNRPRPRVVTPGQRSTYEKAGKAPSDAIVLFDGKDLSNWGQLSNEDPNAIFVPEWKVENGYMEVVGKTGSLRSLDTFGSCQLHIEWASPETIIGSSQGRGNSGVILMGLYEVQVLDSHKNRTYADGQAGAIYGQHPPQVNATRAPGEWQIYDIVFEAPTFKDGQVDTPAYVTVLHNGVLLHHRQKVLGPAAHKHLAEYTEHQPAGPLVLQDHGNPVRFRNIWVRPLD